MSPSDHHQSPGPLSHTIGKGVAVSGSLTGIPWTQGPLFTRLKLDLTNTGICNEFGTRCRMKENLLE